MLQQNNSTKFMITEKNVLVFVVYSTCQIEVLRDLMSFSSVQYGLFPVAKQKFVGSSLAGLMTTYFCTASY